jgi:hypothetical protein
MGRTLVNKKRTYVILGRGQQGRDNEFIFAPTVFRKLDPFPQFPITAQYIV